MSPNTNKKQPSKSITSMPVVDALYALVHAPKRRLPKNPIKRLAAESVREVDDMLFNGCIFGGRSLRAILDLYEENGPHHPIRHELIQHLHRCLEAATRMDAFVIAQAQGTKGPWAKLPARPKRKVQ